MDNSDSGIRVDTNKKDSLYDCNEAVDNTFAPLVVISVSSETEKNMVDSARIHSGMEDIDYHSRKSSAGDDMEDTRAVEEDHLVEFYAVTQT